MKLVSYIEERINIRAYMKKLDNKGQNLLEVVLALGLFFIFLSGSLILVFRYLDTFSRARELQQVRLIAEESLEAVQSIAYNDWADLIDGAYGLNHAIGSWQLQPNPDVIDNKYTREITVSPIERDEDCDIVEAGGEEDPDTKLVTVSINWQTALSPQNRSFSQYFTNWEEPVACLGEEPGGQAGLLLIDVSEAEKHEYVRWINFLIRIDDIKLTNTGGEPIAVDKMQTFWNEPSTRIIGIYLSDGVHYYSRWDAWWHWPGGPQPSGIVLNLTPNHTIQPGQEIKMRMYFFTDASGEDIYRINFIMEDETQIESEEFTL